MKYIILFTLLCSVYFGYSQTNTVRWEKAVSAVHNQNQKVSKTTIEFVDVALNKEQLNEITDRLMSKDELIDLAVIEGKTLIIYHYSSIDDSGIKSLLLPVISTFNVIQILELTSVQVDDIYKSSMR